MAKRKRKKVKQVLVKNYPEYPDDTEVQLKEDAQRTGVTDFNRAKEIVDLATHWSIMCENNTPEFKLFNIYLKLYGSELRERHS